MQETGKKIPFWFSVLPLLVMIAAMIITIVKFEEALMCL